jgi:hypothetical protein
VRQVKDKVRLAKRKAEVGLSVNAAHLWERIYPEISTDEAGQFGAATSRAEAHVRRIALIYALTDGSRKVRTAHLRAALEVWRFCEDSARFIFGGRSAVTLEDRILSALRRSGSGLTRTEINQALHHHVHTTEISRALHVLKEQGLVRAKTLKTGGRSAQYWRAIDSDRA